MLTVLLAIVGAALGFLVGWTFRRTGEPLVNDIQNPAVASTPDATVPSIADVLESHPSGVVLSNADGRIRFRNAAARSLGGTHVGVLIDEAVERHLKNARGGTPSDEVLELYGPPKTVVVVEARPLTDGGAVAFVEDITEQRRTDQVRTDFVANISHELKTPIGALSVLAETLLDADDPATVHRVVDRMMSEAERASRTVDDLMELSRIELGGERAHDPVRVSDIVSGAIDRVTELAARRDISISAPDPSDANGIDAMVVGGDRRQLTSAIGNLVENAVKYSTPGGSVEVRVRCSAERVEISVIDHGVGIPHRDLDRIFERFYRVDRARSRSTGGTGLGLSIVRHVATNHGGEILVSSAEGEGSTFTLRLPAGRSTEPSATAHSEGVA